MQVFDILIVGGGINGCGIARDAAGRGYSVGLVEMNDLASGTSSRSSKLVHGGLRYLEHYEFRLVREALIEREILWSAAPHIIEPLRFVLPHHNALRPAWFLRLGLMIYDHIGGRKALPPTRTLDLTQDAAGIPLKPGYRRAFEYSDCRVDDTRLVILNARDAAARGADIRPRTRAVDLNRDNDRWQATVRDSVTGEEETLSARVLVNAAGPWVDDVLGHVDHHDRPANVRLVQGSHIVVERLFDHDRCYTFQEDDGRIIFAIPYEDDFTLIGTTDHEYTGDPGEAAITGAETDYLLEAASGYFATPLTADHIVWSYAGVRPLYDDGASKAQEATRDYVVKTEGSGGEAPLINIFGGKITTYRKLAEALLEQVEAMIGPAGPPWTDREPLPGGDFPTDGRGALQAKLVRLHPFLDGRFASRLIRLYGTEAMALLDGAQNIEDLGQNHGADLYAREVQWLMDREWARTGEDVLWRRTKLGLRLDSAQAKTLDAWMSEHAS